ncbi:hypothetical protein ACFRK5_16960 [Streptomyces niveus]|uniref:hypothetical protein n=1 Tax=Streptomyces niveus TaxID=193462 RepID=UPI0036C80771
MSARTFVLGHWTKNDATAELHRLAAVLVRAQITDRYGVSVHKVRGRRGAWAVYLTDRTPELGPPDPWARAVIRSFGLAA